MKTKKASKDETTAAVAQLLAFKAEYKEKTGNEYKADDAAAVPRSAPKAAKPVKKAPPAQPKKGETRLGLEATKDTDLSTWFQQIITKGDNLNLIYSGGNTTCN